MYPDIGPIKSYTILYLLGIALHFILAFACSRSLKVRPRIALAISLTFLIGMTTGARLLYDLTRGIPFPFAGFFSVDYYTRGGLWGGPLVHLALATGILAIFKSLRAQTCDLVALALPLPLLVAKVGCFLNGCCYGAQTAVPWAVRFPDNDQHVPANVPLHPTQLYEVAILALTFGLLVHAKQSSRGGLLLPVFLLLYGLGRGLIEFLRGDLEGRATLGAVSVSQLLCFLVAAGSALWLIRLRPRVGAGERTCEQCALNAAQRAERNLL